MRKRYRVHFQLSKSFQDDTSSSELNALGLYLLVSLTFVILAAIEFAFVTLLNRKDSLGKRNSVRSTAEKTTNEIADNEQRNETPNEQNGNFNGWLKAFGKTQCPKNVKQFPYLPLIHAVDFISFFLYVFFSFCLMLSIGQVI